jgi:hypothetical protein
MWQDPQPNATSMISYSCPPHTQWNRINQQLWAFMPRSHQTFCLVVAVKLLGIMFQFRCWPTIFYTITAGDANGWCLNRSVWSTHSAMVSRFCVRPTSKKWFFLRKMNKWPWNMIHSIPCKNPCRRHIHLAFTYSVSPWSVVRTELGPAPPFPEMRVLEM